MAGLKKPSRKKETTSPNIVLVIFLVFFVLVSIGLGVWGYYGYAGQEKLEKATKEATLKEKAAREGENYTRVLADTLALATGTPSLSDDERNRWKVDYEEFNKGDTGLFKKEPTLAEYKKGLDELKQKLGFDDGTKDFQTTFPQVNASLVLKVKDLETKLAKSQKDYTDSQAQFQELKKIQADHWKSAFAKIEESKEDALKRGRDRSEEQTKTIENNAKLNEDLQKADQEAGKVKERLELKIRELTDKLSKKEEKIELVSQGRNPKAQQPLFLDISPGNPLWDRPLGKITRVDMTRREVTISLGSAAGVRPELTFLVFGPGSYGGPDKHLKGTLEVTRVLDPTTSIARITSLYDSTGQEISLGQASLMRIQREAESALHEGDLLFNMFWGSHVAIAGPVNFADGSSTPAEQMRQLSDFIHYLERQGMPVDAYIDMNDGQIKGAITSKTRYLIRSEDLRLTNKDDDRAKMLLENLANMQKEAVDRGLFVISSHNFLNVIGYRRPRSANDPELTGFRPSQPRTVEGVPPALVPGARPNAPDDKGPAPKEMEKE